MSVAEAVGASLKAVPDMLKGHDVMGIHSMHYIREAADMVAEEPSLADTFIEAGIQILGETSQLHAATGGLLALSLFKAAGVGPCVQFKDKEVYPEAVAKVFPAVAGAVETISKGCETSGMYVLNAMSLAALVMNDPQMGAGVSACAKRIKPLLNSAQAAVVDRGLAEMRKRFPALAA